MALPTSAIRRSAVGPAADVAVVEPENVGAEGLAHVKMGADIEAVGKDFVAEGEVLTKKINTVEASRAEASVYSSALTIRKEVESTVTDHNQWEAEYTKRLGKIIDEAGMNISDPVHRSVFQSKAGQVMARGGATMYGLAKTKEHQVQAADTLAMVDNQLEVALGTTDEDTLGMIIDNVHNRIDSAVTRGDITPRTGLILKRGFVKDYAERMPDTMPSQKALDMLTEGRKEDHTFEETGTWTDLIKPDKKNKMIRILENRVEAEEKVDRARVEEQEMLSDADVISAMTDAAGMPLGPAEMRREARKGKRPYERALVAEVMNRYDERVNDQKRVIEGVRTNQVMAHQQVTKMMVEDNLNFANIAKDHPDLVKQLSRDSAIKLRQGHIKTDWPRYNQIFEMNVDQMAALDLGQEVALLAPEEFNIIRNLKTAALQGKLDPSNPNSTANMITSAINSFGLTGSENVERKGRLQTMIRQELALAQKNKGKELTVDEKQTIIHKVTDTTLVPGDYLGKIWTSDKRLFKVEVPDTDRTQIRAAYKSRFNRLPTEYEVIKAFTTGQMK